MIVSRLSPEAEFGSTRSSGTAAVADGLDAAGKCLTEAANNTG